jgi:endonuclease III
VELIEVNNRMLNRMFRTTKETSAFFKTMAKTASPPRRITRSSLSRFAYRDNTAESDPTSEEIIFGSDIEDAITTTSRKRRRVTTTKVSVNSPNGRAVKVEIEEKTSLNSKPAAARKARKPARTTADPETGGTKVEPPSDWEEMYDVVLKMRQPGGVAANAAVDTMGCERLADRKSSPRDQRFHTLIALMLSSQTKDTVNAVVMQRLQTELPAHKAGAPVGLNLENILAVKPELLNQMIWQVGFHNNKTKYVAHIYLKWDLRNMHLRCGMANKLSSGY